MRIIKITIGEANSEQMENVYINVDAIISFSTSSGPRGKTFIQTSNDGSYYIAREDVPEILRKIEFASLAIPPKL